MFGEVDYENEVVDDLDVDSELLGTSKMIKRYFKDDLKVFLNHKEVLKQIDIDVLNSGDNHKKSFYLQSIVILINGLLSLLSKREDLKKYPCIERALIEINESIKIKYGLGDSSDSKPAHKIQWLGKTNVLTTLLFDLWQGQSKGSKKPQSKPLIKAQKKDLMDLLLNNFIDADGNPLKQSTISDYLSTSEDKSTSKAKPGVRIEIPE
jgi:hypothetical protein